MMGKSDFPNSSWSGFRAHFLVSLNTSQYKNSRFRAPGLLERPKEIPPYLF